MFVKDCKVRSADKLSDEKSSNWSGDSIVKSVALDGSQLVRNPYFHPHCNCNPVAVSMHIISIIFLPKSLFGLTNGNIWISKHILYWCNNLFVCSHISVLITKETEIRRKNKEEIATVLSSIFLWEVYTNGANEFKVEVKWPCLRFWWPTFFWWYLAPWHIIKNIFFHFIHISGSTRRKTGPGSIVTLKNWPKFQLQNLSVYQLFCKKTLVQFG